MEIRILESRDAIGVAAAELAAQALKSAIAQYHFAAIVVATGASQFEVLQHLVARDDVDWSKVDGFHLDEYVGLSADHPASFCGYLRARFVERLPLRSFYYLEGTRDPAIVCAEASEAIRDRRIDLALIGIGENGHLAFNDPPADFATDQPYIQVALDDACRQQQVGEGWFPDLESVPKYAVSMSIRQILKAKCIVCSVPDERKASAVHRTLHDPIDPSIPASILRTHDGTTLLLDQASASLLPKLS